MSDYALIGGTRREGGYAVVPREDVAEERRNCWTMYLIDYGTKEECYAELRRLVTEEDSAE